MIKRIKKLIRGGDEATVADARWLVATERKVTSCGALDSVGATPRFIRLYRQHSGARNGYVGFNDITQMEWFRLSRGERLRIRLERLDAFKESLK